jgi:quinol monooxygenase YgiN
MICVIATMEVAAGRRQELLGLLQGVMPKVRAEPGCIEYAPMIDIRSGISLQGPVRDNVVVLIEKWESVDALKTHLKTLHMVEYFEQVEELQLSLDLQIVEPVA